MWRELQQTSILFTIACRNTRNAAAAPRISRRRRQLSARCRGWLAMDLVSCGGKTFLARSDDEGVSWPILRKAGLKNRW